MKKGLRLGDGCKTCLLFLRRRRSKRPSPTPVLKTTQHACKADKTETPRVAAGKHDNAGVLLVASNVLYIGISLVAVGRMVAPERKRQRRLTQSAPFGSYIRCGRSSSSCCSSRVVRIRRARNRGFSYSSIAFLTSCTNFVLAFPILSD